MLRLLGQCVPFVLQRWSSAEAELAKMPTVTELPDVEVLQQKVEEYARSAGTAGGAGRAPQLGQAAGRDAA